MAKSAISQAFKQHGWSFQITGDFAVALCPEGAGLGWWGQATVTSVRPFSHEVEDPRRWWREFQEIELAPTPSRGAPAPAVLIINLHVVSGSHSTMEGSKIVRRHDVTRLVSNAYLQAAAATAGRKPGTVAILAGDFNVLDEKGLVFSVEGGWECSHEPKGRDWICVKRRGPWQQP